MSLFANIRRRLLPDRWPFLLLFCSGNCLHQVSQNIWQTGHKGLLSPLWCFQMWSNASQVGISSTVSATDTSASVSAGKLQSSTVACWELIWSPSWPLRSRVTLTVSSKSCFSQMSECFPYCLLRAECYVFLTRQLQRIPVDWFEW